MAGEAKKEYVNYTALYVVIPNKAAQKYVLPHEFTIKADENAIMDEFAREEANRQLEKLRNELSGSSVTLDTIVHKREVPLTAKE